MSFLVSPMIFSQLRMFASFVEGEKGEVDVWEGRHGMAARDIAAASRRQIRNPDLCYVDWVDGSHSRAFGPGNETVVMVRYKFIILYREVSAERAMRAMYETSAVRVGDMFSDQYNIPTYPESTQPTGDERTRASLIYEISLVLSWYTAQRLPQRHFHPHAYPPLIMRLLFYHGCTGRDTRHGHVSPDSHHNTNILLSDVGFWQRATR